MRKETKSQDGPRSVFLIHVDFACSKIRALFLSHHSENEESGCNIQYTSKRQNCNIPGIEPIVTLRAFISSKYTSGNHEYSLQMILKETNLRFNMSRFPRIVLHSFKKKNTVCLLQNQHGCNGLHSES